MLDLPLFQERRIKVIGIPYDSGQTYLTGSRFAPHLIRLASDSIEEYSLVFKRDVRTIDASDWGDIEVSFGDFTETKRRIHSVLSNVPSEKYVFIGGDHSITFFIISFLGKRIKNYVHLDAHADFEDMYLGSKINHNCVLRRIGEVLGWERIKLVGLRSVSEKALSDLKKFGVEYYTINDISNNDTLCDVLSSADYISIDMDIFDPAFAPEVGNPEPFGLNPKNFLICVNKINPRIVDLVELAPRSPSSITAILAASILREIIITMDVH